MEGTARDLLTQFVSPGLPSAHARLRKVRPDVRATLAAALAYEARLGVRQPHVVGPAVSVGLDMMRATVIAAVDQHIAGAARAHFAEGDFGGVVVMAARGCAWPRWTGKPLQIALDDVPATTGATPARPPQHPADRLV